MVMRVSVEETADDTVRLYDIESDEPYSGDGALGLNEQRAGFLESLRQGWSEMPSYEKLYRVAVAGSIITCIGCSLASIPVYTSINNPNIPVSSDTYAALKGILDRLNNITIFASGTGSGAMLPDLYDGIKRRIQGRREK